MIEIYEKKSRRLIFRMIAFLASIVIVWNAYERKSLAFVVTITDTDIPQQDSHIYMAMIESEIIQFSETETYIEVLDENNEDFEVIREEINDVQIDSNLEETPIIEENTNGNNIEDMPSSEPVKEYEVAAVNQEKFATSEPTKNENVVSYAVTSLKADVYLTDAEGHNLALVNQGKYKTDTEQLLAYINEYRASYGLYELKSDSYLDVMAAHRASESAFSNWFVIATLNGATKHIRPNGGVSATIKEFYGMDTPYAEIMARRFPDVSSALTGWKNSVSHNEMLLTGQFTRIGIGIAQADNGDYYYFCVFTF